MARAEKVFALQERRGEIRQAGEGEKEVEAEEEEGVRGRKTRRRRSRQEWKRRPETASRYFIRGTSQITAGTPSLYVQPSSSFATLSCPPLCALFVVLSSALCEPHRRESSARNRLALVLKYYPPPPPYTCRYTHSSENAHPEENGRSTLGRDTTSSNPRDYVPRCVTRSMSDKFYPPYRFVLRA